MNAPKTVLIATDGSRPSRIAVDLAASICWPVETQLEVLEVLVPAFQATELPIESTRLLEQQERERIDDDLALARSRFVRAAPMTSTAMRRGRAATEVVDEAKRIGAELIVAGSRGRGPVATLLLGSVAAEIVDEAPCPVLIARIQRLQSFVVADDGSANAALALKIAATWPIFKGLRARVVSVAPVDAYAGVAPVKHEAATQAYAENIDALRLSCEATAAAGAAELRHAGFAAESEMRWGDPAHEIVRAALDSEADLIVMGSRGRSGIERLILGSVARNVLTHAPMSVLIVRGLPSA